MGTSDINNKRKKWKQLSEEERYKIESFLKAGWSITQISLELDRDRRTISRESAEAKSQNAIAIGVKEPYTEHITGS